MELRYRRGPSISMFFALFCFFLPFLTLSCPDGSITFTGVEIATDSAAKKEELFGKKESEENLPGQSLAAAALGLTVVAALVSLASGRGPAITTGAIGGLNFILLLILKGTVDQKVAEEGGSMLRSTWGPGFWLALLGYASTAAIVFLILRGPHSAEPEPGPALPAREPD